MQLTFLGTSSGTPTRERNVSAVALRAGGGWDLFDCGEGTQHRLLASPSHSLPKLRRIFVSHLHGDHCFGLFGLLGSRSMAGAPDPLDLYGPVGLEAMVRTVLDASSTYLSYDLRFHVVSEAGMPVVSDGGTTIDAIPLDHRVTSFAWCIREAERPGTLDTARALELGVEEGPAFGQLQRGETVELADGRVVRPSDVLGTPRPGRSLIISGDNRDPAALLARTGTVQLLVHEATYTEDVLARLGDDRGHSTAARVAAAASAAHVPNLVLTHFSPRYQLESSTGPSIKNVHDEASAEYGGCLHLAQDYDEYELTLEGRLHLTLRHAHTRL